VTLRYDPRRIVPPEEHYVFGDPAHRITAHLLFPPSGVLGTVTLTSPSGILTSPDYDDTGDGSVLVGQAAIPEEAGEVALWFAYESPHGETRYDSDFGRNFHFGFAADQVALLQADVRDGVFTARAAALPAVGRLVVQWRIVGREQDGPTDSDLDRTAGRTEAGWPIWELQPVDVPQNAVVNLKLYYWIGGERYKDDDDGLYYLTAKSEGHLPPPPPELARAVEKWTARFEAGAKG
jgi:hypothetical protein